MGRLLAWEAPQIIQTVGPFDPGIFELCATRRRELGSLCRARLREFPDDQIDALFDRGHVDHKQLKKLWDNFLYSEISEASRLPSWYAGGFGHPDHIADFEHWAKMPTFSVAEMTCLSLGIEPKEYSAEELKSLRGRDRTNQWESILFLLKTHELLDRKFDPQKHGWRIQPRDFLIWMDKVDFKAHPEFVRLLRRYHGDPHTKEKQDVANGSVASAKPDKREIDMIAQLLTAIAIDAYGYRPDQARSPIPGEIADVMAKFGLSATPETVRKYLRRGAELLPEGWDADLG
ncbi:hypothetical protein OU426_14330 [Frigidibacter sp. RF13]|nr:hypothetical protein [Frigidibacter sp. RF13]